MKVNIFNNNKYLPGKLNQKKKDISCDSGKKLLQIKSQKYRKNIIFIVGQALLANLTLLC